MGREGLGFLALVLGLACGGAQGIGPVQRVLIPRGASFAEALDSLAAHDLVHGRAWARLVGRVGGFHRTIKPGLYEFRRGMSTLAILQDLRDGRFVTVWLTVPEGLTLLETAGVVESTLAVPRDSFLAAARDTGLLRRHEVGAASAEGFLAPETYLVPAHSSALDVVELMLDQFVESWDPAWDSVAGAAGLSRLEVVTLASIVEGEARVDEERPVIAGVYLNRLRLGMPLQADPTVQYAIQQSTGARKARLFNSDYAVRSRYNTYLHPGLPPGPVNSPGPRSIEAVLHPARVPYLFFVAGPDGRHVFSRTHGEHVRAIARLRRP